MWICVQSLQSLSNIGSKVKKKNIDLADLAERERQTDWPDRLTRQTESFLWTASNITFRGKAENKCILQDLWC